MIKIASYIYQEIDRKMLKPNMYVEILIGDTDIKRGKLRRVISKTKPKDGLIRVELTSGEVGRCIKIISKDEFELENFKFFNIFFHTKYIYSIYNPKDRKYLVLERKYKNNLALKNLMLFSNQEIAEDTLRRSTALKGVYKVVRLNPNKRLSEIIKDIPSDLIIIDLQKVITRKKFNELENKLK